MYAKELWSETGKLPEFESNTAFVLRNEDFGFREAFSEIPIELYVTAQQGHWIAADNPTQDGSWGRTYAYVFSALP